MRDVGCEVGFLYGQGKVYIFLSGAEIPIYFLVGSYDLSKSNSGFL